MLNLVGIYALSALGLILLTGSGGVTSFAQAAFAGIGAYTSAYITLKIGYGPWVGLLAALLIVGLSAVLMGAITLHLGGHYLPITTLAWAVAVFMFLGNLTTLGAHSGIGDLPSVTAFGYELTRPEQVYYLIWAVLVLALIGATNLLSSRMGRSINALRGGALLATSLGVNAFRVRLLLFVLAAELACVSGWLFAHTQKFISPSLFDLNAGMQVLLMSVIGGIGSVLGAVVGSALVMLGRNWIQDILPALGFDAGTSEVVIFGIIFILLIQYSPRGLSPLLALILPTKPAAALPSISKSERLSFSRSMEGSGSASPLLRLEGVGMNFGGLAAVSDLSFEVKPGTIVALIGPNGAGKSTTFDMISGLKVPTKGKVYFADKEVTSQAARLLVTDGLSRTFQHVKLRPKLSLIDNVLMGANWRMKSGLFAGVFKLDRLEEQQYRKTALLALNEVGLGDDAYGLAGNLALGQQRLLEIARSLASDPKMIILDEPAAGLRAMEKQALANLLRHLRNSGMTVLLVEHDMDFVMGLADEIVVLEFGRRIAVGKPEEIRANPRVQEAYLGGIA
ncbi:branched-chain amino acid ABC transporter ATP-binding protein/permease [Ochrobactrum sp. Q0168]|uniref:branched-chain amino acid ABC transporter ATP-binding protein/permease n=1 Tax=Ochrobactrum sp. Q0168 TaxID=2793241 RepID=UPI0018EB0A94|nr:branched-chain amino acid ABC transporter ATP-binding protein/permease [Ochrobactrum sp. Q0168]